jgi:hypothetical protein
MSKFEQGTYVKNKLQPEWGFGVVVEIVSPMLRIRFETAPEPKRFPLGRADEFFEIVPDDAVPNDSRIRDLVPTKPRRSTHKQAGGQLCRVCNGRLNRSAYQQSNRWKSCPNCSNMHGSEHIYRPYPAAFGTTQKRESEEKPDGPQSHCSTCRRKQEPSFAGTDVRRCSEFGPQASDSSKSGE